MPDIEMEACSIFVPMCNREVPRARAPILSDPVDTLVPGPDQGVLLERMTGIEPA